MRAIILLPSTPVDLADPPIGARELLDLRIGGITARTRLQRLARSVGAEAVSVGTRAEVVASPPREPTLIVRADQVLERAPLARLAAAVPDRGFVVLASADGSAAGAAMAAPTSVKAACRWLDEGADDDRLEEPVRRVLLRHGETAVRVSDAEALRHAEHRLWEGCRKAHDGLVSRTMNRHVSLWISRRLVGQPVTPNAISIFNLLLGLAAAAVALAGDYASTLVGAGLLQAASVLDGVDGEIARMRVETSVTGEWLDTVSDDLSNQLFFAALAWGAYRTTGNSVWAVLGVVTFVSLTLVSAVYYTWLVGQNRGDVQVFDWFEHEESRGDAMKEPSLPGRLAAVAARVFRRDSFILLVFVLALLGIAPWALWIAAFAAAGTAMSLLWRVLADRMPGRA